MRERMKLALIHPPACDPTAPYVALPSLAGYLRARGRHVVLIDANIEGFDAVLSKGGMSRVQRLLEERLSRLDAQRALTHQDALAYAALWRARADARAAPQRIDEAKAILRDPVRFFEPASYDTAVAAVEAALRAISAAYYPTFVDFMTYRTPFGLTSSEELERSAQPSASPFYEYLAESLVPRLAREQVGAVGISIAFPGQIHAGYLFGLAVKAALPHVHLTAGGPALTQILARLPGDQRATAMGPFDSAVLFEGEQSLDRLLHALEEGESPSEIPGVVAAGAPHGHGERPAPLDIKALPPPDFDGLPLSLYLSPEPVLPYDPTRGCYWGKCAFCHYGLAERGTATYRERTVPDMAAHLTGLASRHNAKHFYLSHDSVAPKTLVALSRALAERGAGLRWATDLKPEPYVNAERAAELRKGGAVACALGVESASPRVLRLIDKGQPIEAVTRVIRDLAGAGIAVEAMCFTDFPTETFDEAIQTLRFLRRERGSVAGFIVGEFGITHGSRIASDLDKFGIREAWTLAGDMLGLGLLFEPKRLWKTDEQRERIDEALGRLSEGWALRRYPWAGAVSTAHTILHYSRLGASVFRDRSKRRVAARLPEAVECDASFDLGRVGMAEQREAEVWAELLYERRDVSRAAHDAVVATPYAVERSPRRYRVECGGEPVEVGRRSERKQRGRRGAG